MSFFVYQVVRKGNVFLYNLLLGVLFANNWHLYMYIQLHICLIRVMEPFKLAIVDAAPD